jgi:hypothetical protein
MSDAVGVAYVLGKLNGLTPQESWEILDASPAVSTWQDWEALDQRMRERARLKWTTARPVVEPLYSHPDGEVPPNGVPIIPAARAPQF